MIIQHNMMAMNANRELNVTTKKVSKSTEKLSSGYKINRAADDAAGLAISEKMRGQIRGLAQASSNAEDSISLVQTAEGALQETQNILQRLRELSVQAANDTNTEDDRTQIQNEVDQLTNEVDRIASSSEYNTKKLLDGSISGASKYKPGLARVEGSFNTGSIQVIGLKTSQAALVGVDDVIRITIQKDISSGSAVFGPLSGAGVNATISTLNGISATNGNINIRLNVTTGLLEIDNAAYSSTTALPNTTASSTIKIKISSATSLKVGDVITISLSKMTKADIAKNDKESLRLQLGANAGQEMELNIGSVKAKDLGIVRTSTTVEKGISGASTGRALDVTTQEHASLAIEAYNKAIQKVSNERANLGAVQNRLEHSISNLDSSTENLQAAESRIRDVDMADEMTEYSKGNILMQAGQSMLTQANQATSGMLSLLQN